jgi:serine phosphatase RsbU (regulator of sigma subunit)
VFSDGVPEARGHSGALYGYDRPVELLARLETEGLSAEAIRDALIGDVRRFAGESHQSDDVTVLVIKAVQPAGRASAS